MARTSSFQGASGLRCETSRNSTASSPTGPPVTARNARCNADAAWRRACSGGNAAHSASAARSPASRATAVSMAARRSALSSGSFNGRSSSSSRSGGAVTPVQPLPRGWVALPHQLQQSLCLRRQVLIDERLNPGGVRLHQQRFGGGRGVRLVNLFGSFDRDLMFAVGDQLPDAGLRSGTESALIQSRCGSGAGRWPVLRKLCPTRSSRLFLLGGCYLIMLALARKCHHPRARWGA